MPTAAQQAEIQRLNDARKIRIGTQSGNLPAGYQNTPGGVKPIPGGIVDPAVPKQGVKPVAAPAQQAPINPILTGAMAGVGEVGQALKQPYAPAPSTVADDLMNGVQMTPQTTGEGWGVKDGRRLPPTVPTPTSPLVTIGGTTKTTGFDEVNEQDKLSGIALKKYKGENLTDEEFKWLFNYQNKAMSPDTGVSDTLNKQITAEQQRLAETQETQEQRNAKLVAIEDQRLNTQLEQDVAATQKAGEAQGQAVQAALSFSGFGRSTYNADRQGEIAQGVAQREALLRDAKTRELEVFRAQLQGADESTLETIRQGINDMKKQAANLELESAAQVAELNAANKVNSLVAIDNIMKIFSTTTKSTVVDESLTRTINDGYLYTTDETGMPVRMKDASGKEMATGAAQAAEDKALAYRRKKAIDQFNKIREEFVQKGITLSAESGAKFLELLQTGEDPDKVLQDYLTAASENPDVIRAYKKPVKGVKAAKTSSPSSPSSPTTDIWAID